MLYSCISAYSSTILERAESVRVIVTYGPVSGESNLAEITKLQERVETLIKAHEVFDGGYFEIRDEAVAAVIAQLQGECESLANAQSLRYYLTLNSGKFCGSGVGAQVIINFSSNAAGFSKYIHAFKGSSIGELSKTVELGVLPLNHKGVKIKNTNNFNDNLGMRCTRGPTPPVHVEQLGLSKTGVKLNSYFLPGWGGIFQKTYIMPPYCNLINFTKKTPINDLT